MADHQEIERSSSRSTLLYGPVMISDPALGCPLTVAAGRVRTAREGDETSRFVSGWGATFEEAAQGCLREADETYFAQVVPEERILRASADETVGRLIEPPTLTLFSEAQYRGRLGWNRHVDDRHRVPNRWTRSRPLGWIKSDGWLGAGEAWLPAGLCFLGYPHDKEEAGLPVSDSNGLAIGTSLEDAVIRAFGEVVERDATAIWWYNRLILPRIDLPSLADGLVSRYAEWLRTRDRELRLLHLTLDLPIPVVAAISNHVRGDAPAVGFAAGASWSQAARRAVGELAQCEANLALLDERARRFGISDFTVGALHLYRWHCEANIRHLPHLSGGPVTSVLPNISKLDCNTCVEMCRERKLELFVVILRQHDEWPLVRVFVPGLRPTKPRFASGRLYDVPTRLELMHACHLYEAPFPV
ncbi:MAG: hypothetical protein E5W09_09665 [Mesorhizobium sp.]|nr:MAG: hypothetical protein E5W09_09665 [Mesorhizobium sp.]